MKFKVEIFNNGFFVYWLMINFYVSRMVSKDFIDGCNWGEIRILVWLWDYVVG